MNISFILGDWSRNIGNAFFQLGGLHVIKKMLPEAEYCIIPERPGYPSYWNPGGGNPEGFFDMALHTRADILVLMGPMFRKETMSIWGNTFSKMNLSKTRIVLLGVGAMTYDQESVESYRNFLKLFPPYILISRDRETFELLGDLAEHAYDGFDLGFYLPEVYQPVGQIDLTPCIALNFDKIPEPKITISTHLNDDPDGESFYNRTFKFNDEYWNLKLPRIRTKISASSRYLMFLESLYFNTKSTDKIKEYHVIRTDHRPHPMLKRKTYRTDNVLVNDVPYPYLEIYKHAELTMSNRIHACVAALSYGKPAMLISQSPRIRMLERLQLSNITNHPVYLDQQLIQQEKNQLIQFLKGTLLNL